MSLSGRLESCYTGAVHDVLWATGLQADYLAMSEVGPLYTQQPTFKGDVPPIVEIRRAGVITV